ncbi:Alkaline phosphatase synthesis sensor protein PhoR [Caloramator mitchellensis]|uniref:histidine kinase n=1 Tax=Caloramator mitchellensis TaxID=908809 RepID=A0A0R3JYC0_CALMK|nr:HAMP domain-containing sensor histidine kinase [Caloramator mitchellensis]KRQ86132.1 Alkaline phosphatase synthesis sensor protein PhoR [Caloramator mitchellensis]
MSEIKSPCSCSKGKNVECENQNCPLNIIESFNSICHDLKTPLNIILSTLQIMELYDVTGRLYEDKTLFKKYSSMMKQNSLRLIRLVNNILDLTKIDSDLFSMEFVNADIVKVIKNITSSVRDYADLKGIRISVTSNVSEKLMAFDPDKIERILLNLISNALKFTPIGGRIVVKIIDLNEKVILTVQDNGVGMDKEDLKDVFNKFRNMKKNYKENEGTGLGLSLVKRLVEMHNGQINVESKKGRGTKFTIELPVRIIERMERKDNNNKYNLVEKINIEFADIYLTLDGGVR